jgi:tetratricopeptide (TPR) repeat protein
MSSRRSATQRIFPALPIAVALLATHAVMAQTPGKGAATPSTQPDRAAAYYHDSLAHLYEEMAVNNGRPDYAQQAIEEYKLALDADPKSMYLQDGLASLYFKLGRVREAISTAQDRLKTEPNDIAAHELLGKVYLRSLGDGQNPQSGQVLQLAITEYETLARLKPKDLETHLLLGQLYGLDHQSIKAEEQFKIARALDNNSEEAVLNMARLYSEEGQTQQAVTVLSSIPPDDRSGRIDLALGASYDEQHKYKEAAAAYRAALEDEPDNADAQRALGTALMNDDQLDAALVIYKQLAAADTSDIGPVVKIAEIERRQGHYDQSLVTLNKAATLPGASDNLELNFNQAVLYDAMGKYDQSIQTLKGVLLSTAKVDGKYSDPEKSNRAIFLDRLGIVDREANKTQDAADAYKQMAAMGGEYAARGYQGEVDTYRDAHMWKEALAVAAQSAADNPKDKSVQLAYAFNLADTGEPEKGLALAKAQLTGSPGDRDTLIAIASIDMRLHRSADALQNLDKADAISSKPADLEYTDLLRATVYDHDKQYEQAEAQYNKVLAIDPDNSTVLNDFGYMLADRGVRLPEALIMIQKAVKLDPQNGAFLDSLGWVYFKMGQYSLAEENLKKAIARTSSDASIHDHLGEVYEKTGQLQLAVAQWERSLSDYAQSLPADVEPEDVAKVKHKLEDARVKLARVGPTAGKKM